VAARVLVAAEKPEQLQGLAGLVRALGAEGEAVALLAAGREEAEKAAYSVFKTLYYVEGGGRLQPCQLHELLEGLYAEHSPVLVVGAATKNLTDALARLAARHNLPMFTEAVSIELSGDSVTAVRQVLGGRARARLAAGLPAAATVNPAIYAEQAQGIGTGAELAGLKAPAAVLEETSYEPKKREAVDLESAEIVVGVGRGFRRKEDLAMAEELAQLLGGVVGASRPIVADYGWLSEDRWIGISGKKIRPKLYIAIGISGAPQHMAATVDSKVIVAINKDKNAPIFQYADYGVVADLYQFLPVLLKKLREKLGKQ